LKKLSAELLPLDAAAAKDMQALKLMEP